MAHLRLECKGWMQDNLIDQFEAWALFMMFRRLHDNRLSFAIAPTAMSKAGSPPWHRSRVARALTSC